MGASDLHIVAGYPPVLRIHGALQPLEYDVVDGSIVPSLLLPICPPHALARFEMERNADFALELLLHNRPQRLRVNYFMSGQLMGACFRLIPSAIPDFQWAGFPEDLAHRITHFRNGLVLVAGTVGSGKTTSLAMLLQLLNQEGGYRIITVEEPVEYLFPKTPRSVITQREVGLDVHTFADGLKYALRQDPDIILVGEIRDGDTARMALSAAETGHLIFSTLHTRDAKGAISRFADLFPQSDQNEVRSQLALSLRAVVSQHLLPNIHAGEKRVLTMELLFNNSAIAGAIRTGKIEAIDNILLTNRADGMITLDEAIKCQLKDGAISFETAQRFASPGTRL